MPLHFRRGFSGLWGYMPVLDHPGHMGVHTFLGVNPILIGGIDPTHGFQEGFTSDFLALLLKGDDEDVHKPSLRGQIGRAHV